MSLNKMYIIQAFFLVCLLFSQESNCQNNSITIDLDELKLVDVEASELFNNISTIILEPNPYSIISSVRGLHVFDKQFIFLFERFGNGGLFMYDFQGRFLRIIGREHNILDITIDPVKRDIYMLAANRRTMHIYDFNGKHINSINFSQGEGLHRIQFYNDKIYMVSNQPIDYLVRVFDVKSGKITEGYLPVSDNIWSRFIMFESFYNRANGVPKFIHPFFSNFLSLKDMKPYVSMKSKNFPTALEIERILRHNDEISQITEISRLTGVRNFRHYFESENLIYFAYTAELSDNLSILHNKRINTTHHFKISNNLLYQKSVNLFNFSCFDENGAYEIYTAGEFINIRDRNLLNSNIDKRNRLSSINNESNPIIFYYEFKNPK